MRLRGFTLASLAVLALAGPAGADDSGNFVMTLGRDTVSAEHYVRTPAQLVVDQVGRAPRTLRRHFVYDYANGALTHLSFVVTPPGATTPTQTIDAAPKGDSLVLHIQSGAAPAQDLSVMLPAGTLVQAASSPWSTYEERIMQLVAGKADSVNGPQYLLGAPTLNHYSMRKLGRDSVEVVNDRGDVYHAHVDRAGRVLGVLPVHGTAKFGVTRVAKIDIDALAASFAAAEHAGAAMGTLSPRDTVRAMVGSDSLWVDYSRPSKRGRAIFGGAVVPYGEVWRTGANAATQFRTSQPLHFGDVTVPAGFYTLWTMPTAQGWKLLINGETGQWGTEHKADKDLYTIDMKVESLPQVVEKFTIGIEASGAGGVLNLDWDTTRASAAFTVGP